MSRLNRLLRGSKKNEHSWFGRAALLSAQLTQHRLVNRWSLLESLWTSLDHRVATVERDQALTNTDAAVGPDAIDVRLRDGLHSQGLVVGACQDDGHLRTDHN